jgi:hypothetical protein
MEEYLVTQDISKIADFVSEKNSDDGKSKVTVMKLKDQYGRNGKYFTWQKGKGVLSTWTNDVCINIHNFLSHFISL